MSLSTPHLFYIFGAYFLTLVWLVGFFVITFVKWKKSIRLLSDTSDEA